MPCYLIRDDQVTVLESPPASVSDDAILIRKAGDFDLKRFTAARLATIRNGLPGVAPVQRFKDRATATKALWSELRKLPLAGTSKQATVIGLLQRPEGCTIDDLVSATGWQAHSVRGLLSGVLRKKLGLNVENTKSGNSRIYRIAA